ncbi:TVP38/TMEM64 family protein [Thalassotalea aquiviva]|uniref:TVP38/TMEM64 family protein n=1 Tax=Thalassotalea aquiviva TaxID=3242415 RepID=UPI00352AD4D5
MLNIFGFLNQYWIDQHIKNSGIEGVLTLLAVLVFGMSFGLPRQIAAFMAGYAFNTLYGTLLATFAAMMGCAITFYTARIFFRPIIMRFWPEKVILINRFLQQQTFTKTLILRLLPVGNNFLLNATAGIGQVPSIRYIFASYIGFFPQMIIFALMGSGISVLSGWQIGFSLILVLIATVLSLRLYRRHKLTQH